MCYYLCTLQMHTMTVKQNICDDTRVSEIPLNVSYGESVLFFDDSNHNDDDDDYDDVYATHSNASM